MIDAHVKLIALRQAAHYAVVFAVCRDNAIVVSTGYVEVAWVLNLYRRHLLSFSLPPVGDGLRRLTTFDRPHCTATPFHFLADLEGVAGNNESRLAVAGDLEFVCAAHVSTMHHTASQVSTYFAGFFNPKAMRTTSAIERRSSSARAFSVL